MLFSIWNVRHLGSDKCLMRHLGLDISYVSHSNFYASIFKDVEGAYWFGPDYLRVRNITISQGTNSSSCTTTELFKLLTSCLTTIKNHVTTYCEKGYERSGKISFSHLVNQTFM